MFTWKQKEIKTYGDVKRALLDLESREEAQEFMHVYLAHHAHADETVGYSTGYFNRDDADRVMDWCEVSHPIFGRTLPTPEQAFETGHGVGDRADASVDYSIAVGSEPDASALKLMRQRSASQRDTEG